MNTSASTPGTSRARARRPPSGPCSASSALVVDMVERDLVGQILAQMRDIVIFARAVDDHVDRRPRPAREHQIVEDAAILREQQRIFLVRRACTPFTSAGHQRFERVVEAVARQSSWPMWLTSNSPADLAHPQMLGHDAFILDRHVIARERHHPPAARAVPRVERERLQLYFDIVVGKVDVAQARSPQQMTARQRPAMRRISAAPSVTEPESFHRSLESTGLPLRWPGCEPDSFQSVAIDSAVRLPERFRGGCSFGGQARSPPLSRACLCRLPAIDAAALAAPPQPSQSRT